MKRSLALLVVLLSLAAAQAQDSTKAEKPWPAAKWDFGDGQYIQLTFLNQVWLRNTQTNPGTTVFGDPEPNITDISLRRTRLCLFGQMTPRVYIYMQFGINNFNYISERKQGAFFHDAIVQYDAVPGKLSLGMGLTAWTGFSRFSSPSIGTLMGLDAPLFLQATNDATDQFLRKLSVYAKGQIGKLDYRLAFTSPMAIQNSPLYTAAVGSNSTFSNRAPNPQLSGYAAWNFLESESNKNPYQTGTYLGKKKVLNLGAGFEYQDKAMWHLNNQGDTTETSLGIWAVDVFYDAPINAKGAAVSFYGLFSQYDFGPNYLRNVGVNNPANGTNGNGTVNGAGNGFPMIGTGSVLYGQLGYKFKDGLLGDAGTLMPYVTSQYANYEALDDPMHMYEGGVNWLMAGHNAKLSLAAQSRPIFQINDNGEAKQDGRRGMYVMQYQIAF